MWNFHFCGSYVYVYVLVQETYSETCLLLVVANVQVDTVSCSNIGSDENQLGILYCCLYSNEDQRRLVAA